MKITRVYIKPVEEYGKLKATASVVFDDVFVLHDIKIIKTRRKTFLAMPSKRVPEGVYKDIAHPIDPEFRRELEAEILQKFYEEVDTSED